MRTLGECSLMERGWVRWALAFVALILAPCLSAGCGAGGDEGPPPPVELTVPAAHNVGEDCTASACHNDNASLAGVSAAGTVYVDAAGSAPAPGVSVRLQEVANPAVSVTATTNDDGNFALAQAALDAGKEYSMSITDGVTTQSMTMTRLPEVSCNWCHHAGGPAGFRVNLQGAP